MDKPGMVYSLINMAFYCDFDLRKGEFIDGDRKMFGDKSGLK